MCLFRIGWMEQFLFSLLWLMMGVMAQQRTLVYFDESLTWKAAQARCRLFRTDLVTIRTKEDNDQLNYNTWLGLYRDNSSSAWKWSRRDESLTFKNEWESGYSPTDGTNCVYKHDGDRGPWRSYSCSDEKKFYCSGENLFLVKQKKTWEKALAHCRAMTSGGHKYDLASLITAEDHASAKNQLTDTAWTGLRFLGDHWVWVSGEKVQYEGMETCPYEKRCGMLDKSNAQNYDIENCEEQKHFFCFKKPI